MKWPWVARAVYEDAVQAVAVMRTREVMLTNRYDALLDRYHALKLAGATPEPTPAEVVPVPPRVEDEARTLISEVCGNNYAKRSMMLKQLAMDRADGKDEDAILSAIRNGIPTDGVPA